MTERERALQSLRESFSFFGCPTDDLSDDELERGVVTLQQTMFALGLSLDEAARAFRALTMVGAEE